MISAQTLAKKGRTFSISVWVGDKWQIVHSWLQDRWED
jgi:hypothetical protein